MSRRPDEFIATMGHPTVCQMCGVDCYTADALEYHRNVYHSAVLLKPIDSGKASPIDYDSVSSGGGQTMNKHSSPYGCAMCDSTKEALDNQQETNRCSVCHPEIKFASSTGIDSLVDQHPKCSVPGANEVQKEQEENGEETEILERKPGVDGKEDDIAVTVMGESTPTYSGASTSHDPCNNSNQLVAPSRKLHICEICYCVFATGQALENHQRIAQLRNGHLLNVCPMCGIHCYTREDFVNHEKTCHPAVSQLKDVVQDVLKKPQRDHHPKKNIPVANDKDSQFTMVDAEAIRSEQEPIRRVEETEVPQQKDHGADGKQDDLAVTVMPESAPSYSGASTSHDPCNNPNQLVAPSPKLHICENCSCVFATGQALENHQRILVAHSAVPQLRNGDLLNFFPMCGLHCDAREDFANHEKTFHPAVSQLKDVVQDVLRKPQRDHHPQKNIPVANDKDSQFTMVDAEAIRSEQEPIRRVEETEVPQQKDHGADGKQDDLAVTVMPESAPSYSGASTSHDPCNNPNQLVAPRSKLHICENCSCVFATGQALENHQRILVAHSAVPQLRNGDLLNFFPMCGLHCDAREDFANHEKTFHPAVSQLKDVVQDVLKKPQHDLQPRRNIPVANDKDSQFTVVDAEAIRSEQEPIRRVEETEVPQQKDHGADGKQDDLAVTVMPESAPSYSGASTSHDPCNNPNHLVASSPKLHICEICFCVFATGQALENHQRIAHSAVCQVRNGHLFYVCPMCGLHCDTREDFANHEKTCHPAISQLKDVVQDVLKKPQHDLQPRRNIPVANDKDSQLTMVDAEAIRSEQEPIRRVEETEVPQQKDHGADGKQDDLAVTVMPESAPSYSGASTSHDPCNNPNQLVAPSPKLHICENCYCVFATGQALENHQRILVAHSAVPQLRNGDLLNFSPMCGLHCDAREDFANHERTCHPAVSQLKDVVQDVLKKPQRDHHPKKNIHVANDKDPQLTTVDEEAIRSGQKDGLGDRDERAVAVTEGNDVSGYECITIKEEPDLYLCATCDCECFTAEALEEHQKTCCPQKEHFPNSCEELSSPVRQLEVGVHISEEECSITCMEEANPNVCPTYNCEYISSNVTGNECTTTVNKQPNLALGTIVEGNREFMGSAVEVDQDVMEIDDMDQEAMAAVVERDPGAEVTVVEGDQEAMKSVVEVDQNVVEIVEVDQEALATVVERDQGAEVTVVEVDQETMTPAAEVDDDVVEIIEVDLKSMETVTEGDKGVMGPEVEGIPSKCPQVCGRCKIVCPTTKSLVNHQNVFHPGVNDLVMYGCPVCGKKRLPDSACRPGDEVLPDRPKECDQHSNDCASTVNEEDKLFTICKEAATITEQRFTNLVARDGKLHSDTLLVVPEDTKYLATHACDDPCRKPDVVVIPSQNPFLCEICGCNCRSAESLKDHQRIYHTSNDSAVHHSRNGCGLYVCSMCCLNCCTQKGLDAHKKIFHPLVNPLKDEVSHHSTKEGDQGLTISTKSQPKATEEGLHPVMIVLEATKQIHVGASDGKRTKTRRLKCKMCGSICATTGALNDHLAIYHPTVHRSCTTSGLYACPLCGLICYTQEILANHKMNFHPSFYVDIPKERGQHFDDSKHIANEEDPQPGTSKEEARKQKDQAVDTNDGGQDINTMPMISPVAPRYSGTKAGHYRCKKLAARVPSPHICEMCGHVCPTTESLEDHQIIHHSTRVIHRLRNGSGLYVCQMCGLNCYTRMGLEIHKKIFHLQINFPHVCEMCDHVLPTAAALGDHQKRRHRMVYRLVHDVHEVPPPKECQTGDHDCPMSDGVDNHMNVHPKNCLESENSEKQSSQVPLEGKDMSTQTPPVCEICGHDCHTTNELVDHQKTVHHVVYPLKSRWDKVPLLKACQKCNQDVKVEGLVKHQMEFHPEMYCRENKNGRMPSHQVPSEAEVVSTDSESTITVKEEVDPYACPMCDYTGLTAEALEQHWNTTHCEVKHGRNSHDERPPLEDTGSHVEYGFTGTGKKQTSPFVCPMCHYVCTTKDALETHQRTFHWSLKNMCDLCTSICPTAEALKHHQRLFHPEVFHLKRSVNNNNVSPPRVCQTGHQNFLTADHIGNNQMTVPPRKDCLEYTCQNRELQSSQGPSEAQGVSTDVLAERRISSGSTSEGWLNRGQGCHSPAENLLLNAFLNPYLKPELIPHHIISKIKVTLPDANMLVYDIRKKLLNTSSHSAMFTSPKCSKFNADKFYDLEVHCLCHRVAYLLYRDSHGQSNEKNGTKHHGLQEKLYSMSLVYLRKELQEMPLFPTLEEINSRIWNHPVPLPAQFLAASEGMESLGDSSKCSELDPAVSTPTSRTVSGLDPSVGSRFYQEFVKFRITALTAVLQDVEQKRKREIEKRSKEGLTAAFNAVAFLGLDNVGQMETTSSCPVGDADQTAKPTTALSVGMYIEQSSSPLPPKNKNNK